jgi:hypothetical protein
MSYEFADGCKKSESRNCIERNSVAQEIVLTRKVYFMLIILARACSFEPKSLLRTGTKVSILLY